MRTLSTAEQDVVLGTHFNLGSKIEVETSSGGFNDLTSFVGNNWFVGFEMGEDVDQPIAEGRAFVRRDLSTSLSLSPLRTDSTANQNSTGGVTLAIDVGREIKLYTAMVAASCSPGSTDYKLLFHGEVDEWDAREDPIELRCRDLGGPFLQDRWIESTGVSYGSSSGTAMETVIQNILSSQLSTDAPTLLTPTSPGFLITKYQPEQQPVMQSVQRLADHIGWDVRYRWANTSSAFFLTLYEPSRTSTTPNSTFSPGRYAFIRKMALDRQDIRNVVTVEYPTSSGRQRVTAQATSSIDLYGRRWLFSPEDADSPINTSSEANTLANAILDDLKDPKAEKEVEMHLFWPVQLGDLYRFQANNVQYNADQDLAVTGYRHIVRSTEHRTILSVRGKPMSKSGGWIAQQVQGPVFPEIPAFQFVQPTFQEDIAKTPTGGTGSVNIVVKDPSRAITKGEFAIRQGQTATTGFSTAWSSVTGTEGQSSQITFTKTLDFDDGTDTEFRWRCTHLNEQGASVITEGSGFFPQLREVTKNILFGHAAFGPALNTAKWAVDTSSDMAGLFTSATSSTQGFVSPAVFPPAVTLTNISVRLFMQSTADTASVALEKIDSTGALSTLATLSAASCSWQTKSAALSEAVSTAHLYRMRVRLHSATGGIDAGFGFATLTYTMNQYSKGY